MKILSIIGFIILINPIFSFSQSIPTTTVLEGGQIAFLDSLGKPMLNTYDYVFPSSDTTYYFANVGGEFCDSANVVLDGKWGFIDALGMEITPMKYDLILPFLDSKAIVQLDSLYGFVNYMGDEICSIEFDKVEDFVNGLAFVCKGGKCGYINKKGEYIVPLDTDLSVNNIVPESYWNY